MQVFLETGAIGVPAVHDGRCGQLVSLDADPDVMRFVTGGIPTSRDEVENEVLITFIRRAER